MNKFVFYSHFIKNIGVQPPFSSFQQSILKYININFTQVMFNAWASQSCLYSGQALGINIYVLLLSKYLFQRKRYIDLSQRINWILLSVLNIVFITEKNNFLRFPQRATLLAGCPTKRSCYSLLFGHNVILIRRQQGRSIIQSATI